MSWRMWHWHHKAFKWELSLVSERAYWKHLSELVSPRDVISKDKLLHSLWIIMAVMFFLWFQLKDYRCVNDEECNTKYDSNGLERPFKPFRGQCLSKCPEHTKEKNGTCVTCSEDCPTECPGGNITSTDALATFVGCTVIKGSLSIQLKGSK